MTFTRPPVPDPALLQLLAELHGYEAIVRRLGRELRDSGELVLFGEPGKAMERLRTLADGLPQLSAQWVMLMISHTELMHNLWRYSQGAALDVEAEVRDHLACASALGSRCDWLLSQGGRVLH